VGEEGEVALLDEECLRHQDLASPSVPVGGMSAWVRTQISDHLSESVLFWNLFPVLLVQMFRPLVNCFESFRFNRMQFTNAAPFERLLCMIAAEERPRLWSQARLERLSGWRLL
jgi:hypothetical protein